MLKKEAIEITGGLSKPGKMPEGSFNLPAWACQTGSILRKFAPNSPCHDCYAFKFRYRFKKAKKALQRRLDKLHDPRWVNAMVTLIEGKKFFRWHDSGDVQSVQHLKQIFSVCDLTPGTMHWLPTQERKYLPDPEEVPDNLIIRLSGSKINGPSPTAWEHTSSVVTDGSATCPAPSQGGKCRECRACWTKSIKNVSYGKH